MALLIVMHLTKSAAFKTITAPIYDEGRHLAQITCGHTCKQTYI